MSERPRSAPLRLGATSYVIADGLTANAHYLSEWAQDMQLVLFDLPGGPSNLPDSREVDALARLGAEKGLSYTVHLLDDVWLGLVADLRHPSMQRARQLIDLTRPLSPWAYVLHLDGRSVRSPSTGAERLRLWQDACVRALEHLALWTGDPALLAVENLEGYPPDFVGPMVERAGVSRCVDVGHLWLDGHDPLPHLAASLDRLRVVHLHGLSARQDHQSLAHTSPHQLDPVTAFLAANHFAGVLTLEVFGEEDFHASRQALMESLQRFTSRVL